MQINGNVKAQRCTHDIFIGFIAMEKIVTLKPKKSINEAQQHIIIHLGIFLTMGLN